MNNLTGETALLPSSCFQGPRSRRFGYRFEIAEAIKGHPWWSCEIGAGRESVAIVSHLRILEETIHRLESDGLFAIWYILLG